LKIENYQLADIIFPYLHISIFPSPSGEEFKLLKGEQGFKVKHFDTAKIQQTLLSTNSCPGCATANQYIMWNQRSLTEGK